MLRAKNQIVHPVSSAERAAFRSVDRAITPRRTHTRKRPAPNPAELKRLSASVDQLGANSRTMADGLLDWQRPAPNYVPGT
jgi:hypothetical protein